MRISCKSKLLHWFADISPPETQILYLADNSPQVMGELADYNKESEKKTTISPKQNPLPKVRGWKKVHFQSNPWLRQKSLMYLFFLSSGVSF
jgi:hypothetical protein